MMKALKITTFTVGMLVVAVFAIYCKAGFFDYLWAGIMP